MDAGEYATMFAVEDTHWWYAGMRRITSALLDSCVLPRPLSILDAGCGSGGNLRLLEAYGAVTGVDIAPAALTFCRQRGFARLARASVCALPFAAASFDLVTSFEVLYHLAVASDEAALREFWRVLRPGGWLLLRLPAHDWLRGQHDIAVHTRHRYTTAEVGDRVSGAGFAIVRLSYANCLLFPLATAKRLLERVAGGGQASDVGPPPRANAILAAILAAEARWLARRNLPWGLSVLCLARKPGGAHEEGAAWARQGCGGGAEHAEAGHR